MTERERIISGFSDSELLKFYELGGVPPHRMLPRLARLIQPEVCGCLDVRERDRMHAALEVLLGRDLSRSTAQKQIEKVA